MQEVAKVELGKYTQPNGLFLSRYMTDKGQQHSHIFYTLNSKIKTLLGLTFLSTV